MTHRVAISRFRGSERRVHPPHHATDDGKAPLMYIGIGTVVVILLIILLLMYVF